MTKFKKGFTVIELIAVIVVLAIILAIAVPTITGIIRSAQNKVCTLDAQVMENAAKKYVSLEGVEISTGQSISLSLNSLISSKYITDIIDPTDRKTPCDGFVEVTNENGIYKYEAAINCPQTCQTGPYVDENGDNSLPSDLDTTLKYGAKYFEGANPNNWVKFGRMDENNRQGIMWRIVKIDDTGIKMIYEGIENGSKLPLEDGRALIDGTMGIAWNSFGNNKWNTPTSLVNKLNNWISRISIPEADKYLTKANWRVGGVPYQNPTIIMSFIDHQDINSTNTGGNFSGYTNYQSYIGTLNAVDFMLTSDNPECSASYMETGSTNECAYNVDTSSNNFLQKDKYHYWTLNARSDTTNMAWMISNSGLIGSNIVNLAAVSVRPVLNLKLDTQFLSGTGTLEDPFIVEEYMENILHAPLITLNGDSTVYIRQNDIYTDLGATAVDEEDGDLSSQITKSGTVNTSIVGQYSIEYNVTDSDGNDAPTMTRKVIVVDRDKPIITLNGDNPIYLTIYGTYNEPGATAFDINYGDISDDITVTGTVDPNVLGTYYLKYNVTNQDGVKAYEVERRVIVQTPKPIITLNGPSQVIVDIGGEYNEQGVTAIDEVDGDLTDAVVKTITFYNEITKSWGPVNNISTASLGTYQIKYEVTNSFGANAFVTRTIRIVAVEGPNITFTPDESSIPQKSSETVITVNKTLHDINNASLKYFIYTNTTKLNTRNFEYNFTTPYKNGDTLKISSGTGYYYFYAIAKDTYGDTRMKNTKAFIIDNYAPVIRLNTGPSNILVGKTYTDPGASAFDKYFDGDITNKMTTTSTVDTSIVGTYTISYEVSDRAGNSTKATRTVQVYHSQPTIYLNGGSNIKLNYGTPYVEPGATAKDEVDGDLTNNIVISGSVDHYKEGSYQITYSVTNSSGYTTTRTRTVEVIIPTPTITILGNNPDRVMVKGVYADAGATAYDELDGDLTNRIVTTGTISTADRGKYTITYSVTNNLGKTATAVREVTVYVPTPVITLIGTNPVKIIKTQPYTDEGATATDDLDGDLTDQIITTGEVNVFKEGLYAITYSVTNSEGETTTLVRNVRVDISTIIMKLNGDSTVSILKGDQYTDAGATATDQIDGDITDSIVVDYGAFNVNVPGSYTIKYTATNSGGDTKTITRSVIVEEPEVKITLNGPSSIEIARGAVYSDPGYTATDEIDGDITANVIVNFGSFNNLKAGTYTINYSVTNSSGRTATATRTIIVKKSELSLNLLGETIIEISRGATYSDPGYTATDSYDGNLTSQVSVDNGGFISTKAGTYTFTYSITNSGGETVTKTRTVTVKSTLTLTLNGASTIEIERGAVYSDPGYTATDDLEGDLTNQVSVDYGSFDPLKTGTYIFNYSVTNSGGETATATRTIVVKPSQLTLTLLGDASIEILKGSTYSDPGYTASDSVDGDITDDVTVNYGSFTPNIVGTYTFTYSVTNSGGDTKSITRTVKVRNPVITIALKGDSYIELPLGMVYVDAGATATDEILGDVSDNIIATPDESFNPNVIGTYHITYSITSSGITETTSRTVKVIPLPGPTITYSPNGNSTYQKMYQTVVTITKGDNDVNPNSYKYLWKTNLTMPTASDFTTSFNSGDTIQTPSGESGRYYLWVIAQDIYGNTSILSSNGFSIDNTVPVLTLIGDRVIETPIDGIYVEKGVKVTEADSGIDSNGVVITSTIVPGIIGTYTVTYNATDKVGLKAIPVTRTVSVIEASLAQAPVYGDAYKQLYDSSYFVGPNPSNWVEFGNAATNGDDYIPILWRIIKANSAGIKIVYEGVKNTAGTGTNEDGFTGSYAYDTTNSNVWNRPASIRSVLDTLYTGLNEADKNTLTSKINWCVGKTNSPYKIENFRADECLLLGNTTSSIGLLSAADYILTSKDPCNAYNQASCGTNNFLHKSYSYTTISTDATSNVTSFVVNSNGALTREEVNKLYNLRPVINLRSDVLILGGEGTIENPYKLNTRVATLDNLPPSIKFTPNSATGYIEGKAIEVVVTDDVSGVDDNSLKYVWTKSSTQPAVDQIINSFTNGAKISLPTDESSIYYLWVLAKDKKNNQKIARGGSYDLDNTPPVITITGNNPYYMAVGGTYRDPGATALDNKSGTIAVTITSNVNPSIAGVYTVTYTATDNAGNTATASREVNVVEVSNEYDPTKGMNTPVLFAGMTPIRWVGTNEMSTSPTDNAWYDYSNQQWANAKTADGSYWVWIPRFAYQITSNYHTNVASSFSIKFLIDNTNIAVDGTNVGTTPTYSGGVQTNYVIHPAFTFGNQELTGIWVAKFEASGTASNVKSIPNATAITNLNISDSFNAAYYMRHSTTYGWNSGETETHMMKNNEWSAIAYLSRSSYGKSSEVWPNTSTTYITGCSGNSATDANYAGCRNAYNTATGFNASTTGNIYGVYDMNGGALEFVAAYVNNGNANLNTYGSSIINANAKYKDIFTITTDSQANNYNNASNKFGQAIYETSSTYSGGNSWYGDYSYMPYSSTPWMSRGGNYGGGSTSGVFNFYQQSGAASTGGFRPVIVPSAGPKVVFTPNGVTTRGTTIKVGLSSSNGIDASSLKYQWTTSTTEPTAASFTTTFTNNGNINTPNATSGTYYLWITGNDTNGNNTTTRSEAVIIDTTNPVITLNGVSPIKHKLGTAYVDAGVTATDNVDTNVAISIQSDLNPNVRGNYTITYTATDDAGNSSSISRTIIVDVKEIRTAQDLYNVRNDSGADYIVMNNIDMSTSAYADNFPAIPDFNGSLDGKGFKILNLKVNTGGIFTNLHSGAQIYDLELTNFHSEAPTTSYVGSITGRLTETNVLLKDINISGASVIRGSNYVGGLIGQIEALPNITNIFVNSIINGGNYVGGLAGSVTANGSSFDNITTKGNITATGSSAGGLIGYSTVSITVNNSASGAYIGGTNNIGGLIGYVGTTSIINSTSSGTVNGNSNVGGLVGNVTSSSNISGSSSTATVNASTNYAGGLIGMSPSTTITNSYASGDVSTSGTNAGGLLGYNSSTYLTISQSYSTSNVTATNGYAGGLVGNVYRIANISNSYASGNIFGKSFIGGLVGNLTGYNSTNMSTISKCYASGNVESTTTAGEASSGGLIGYAGYTNISDTFAAGNVKSVGGYAGGLVGHSVYVNFYRSYVLGKLTGPSALFGYYQNSTSTNTYWIGETTGVYSGNYATLISSIIDGTDSTRYTGFDFTNVWGIEYRQTTPYLRGLMIPDKNYLINNAEYAGSGSGTAEDPYLVYNAEDLYNMRNSLGSYYKLVNDIDMSTSAYATNFPTIVGFNGNFDGNGKTISNLKMNRAMFDSYENITISDLTLNNVTVNGSSHYTSALVGTGVKITLTNINITGTSSVRTTGSYSGGLVGYSTGVISITNSNSNAAVQGSSYVGGLVGYSTSSTTINGSSANTTAQGSNNIGGLIGQGGTISIINSTSSGTISGSNYVGGLAGNVNSSINVSGSSSTATVTASTAYVGGLIGMSPNTTITNSYASGDISTPGTNAGGLLGYNSSTYLTISQSYSTSNVTATNGYAGGLVGNVYRIANISNSYASGNIFGKSFIGGLVGNLTGYNNTNMSAISKCYASGSVESTTTAGEASSGGLIGYAGYANISDTFEAGNVKSVGGYAGGIVGHSVYVNFYRSYVLGKLTGPSALFGYYQNSTSTNTYWIGETTGVYSGNYATLISSIIDATDSTRYTGFDFTNVWNIEYRQTTPYLRGLIVPDKNYLSNNAEYAGSGSGTAEDPYLVTNAEDLYNMRNSLGSYYKLVNDIDMSTSAYASDFSTIVGFNGNFDGNGKTISNLKMNRAMFDSYENITISDLTLNNVTVNGSSHYTSALVGTGVKITLTNINITGTSSVRTTGSYSGGLVGYSTGVTSITNSNSNASVQGSSYVGGLVGYSTSSTAINGSSANTTAQGSNNIGGLIGQGGTISIINSTSSGTISGNNYVGGLAGNVNSSINVSGSSSTATVTASTAYVGGLIGMSPSTTITNSYASGVVSTSGTNAGGLLGYNSSTYLAISQSYSTSNVTATNGYAGGLVGNVYRIANISLSYASGNIFGKSFVGGLVGNLTGYNNTNMSTVSKCYASGSVESTTTAGEASSGGLIGYAGFTNVQDTFTAGNIKSVGGYAGGLVGNSYYTNFYRSYVLGKLTGPSALFGYYQNSTSTNTYWIGETTGVYSGNYATLISSIIDATDSARYTGFDFTNVWNIEYRQTTPYLRGLIVPDKNYLINNAEYEGSGSGTAEDPYLVTNAEDLYNMRNSLGSYYKLVNDIDMSTSAYASDFPTIVGFNGNFNGNGKTISNLKMNRAMFDSYENITISDLTLNNVTVNGSNPYTSALVGTGVKITLTNINVTGTSSVRTTSNYAGGLVGYSTGVISITNSNSSSSVQGSSYVGGLVGYSTSSTTINGSSANTTAQGSNNIGGLIGQGGTISIINSTSSGTISGNNYVGGLAGNVNSSINVSGSSSTATSTASTSYVGGLVGMSPNTTITNSYASGVVSTSGTNAGGLLGYNSSTYLTISQSYSTSNVTATNGYAGGLVGNVYRIANISLSYASGNIFGKSFVGGLVGNLTGNNTTNMSTISKCYASGSVESTTTAGEASSGGLIGYAGFTNVQDTFTAGNVKSVGGYAGGLVGNSYYTNFYRSYVLGKLTGPAALFGYYQSSTSTNTYWIGETTGVYSGNYATLISSIIDGTDSARYTGFDFTNIWNIEYRQTTPYLRGLIVPDKNYLSNNAEYAGSGSGTAEDPYLVNNAEDLYNMRNSLGSYYKLVNDIDMSTSAYASNFPTIVGFNGNFDGNGKTISNLNMNRSLFDSYENITISNLTLNNVTVNGSSHYTSALVGTGVKITLTNINVTGTSNVRTTGSYSGGLVGYSTGVVSITNSNSNAAVQGASYVGGLVGYSTSSTTINGSSANTAAQGANGIGGLIGQGGTISIINSTASGTISGSNYVGGLVGNVNSSINVSGSSSTATATASTAYAGGIVGMSPSTTITNSYASGEVSTSGTNAGGLLGYNSSTYLTISQSYSTSNVTATNGYAGGLVGNVYRMANISLSYSSGNIFGKNFVGGLVGNLTGNNTTNMSTVSKCYASGSVESTTTAGEASSGGLIGYAGYTNINDTFAAGSVKAAGGYAGGLIGRTYYSYIYRSYVLGALTNTLAFIGYNQSSNATNTYWIAPTTGVSSGSYATMISTITDATTSSTYVNFDFTNVWNIEANRTSPYLRGVTIPGNIYIN